jgi:hypothetical protein
MSFEFKNITIKVNHTPYSHISIYFILITFVILMTFILSSFQCLLNMFKLSMDIGHGNLKYFFVLF